jgi:hypothetical protein
MRSCEATHSSSNHVRMVSTCCGLRTHTAAEAKPIQPAQAQRTSSCEKTHMYTVLATVHATQSNKLATQHCRTQPYRSSLPHLQAGEKPSSFRAATKQSRARALPGATSGQKRFLSARHFLYTWMFSRKSSSASNSCLKTDSAHSGLRCARLERCLQEKGDARITQNVTTGAAGEEFGHGI